MSFYTGKRVVLTGGAGFIGSHVTQRLLSEGAEVIVVDNLSRTEGKIYNLTAFRVPESIIPFEALPKGETPVARNLVLMQRDLEEPGVLEEIPNPDIVIHMASKVSNIEYNNSHHLEMYTRNVLMNTQVMESVSYIHECRPLERFAFVSTSCVYSHEVDIPTREEEALPIDPEPTNYGYGLAKLVGEQQARMLAASHGVPTAIVRFFNAYGTRDHFDWESSHVIPALIRKALEHDEIVVWGTGKQTRSFVWAPELAEGLLRLTECYAVTDPVHICSAQEVSVADLAERINTILGTNKRILLDPNRPDGYQRRAGSLDKLARITGWVPTYPLGQGLRNVCDWYRNFGFRYVSD